MTCSTQFFFQERKTFTGHWVNGKRTGPGKMIWLNGEEYNGEWLNNLQVNFRQFRQATFWFTFIILTQHGQSLILFA